MLTIHHELPVGKTSTDAESGDVNLFLRNVLVEVTAENYRQLMHELLSHDTAERDLIHLDPPLRANERIVSGLFANALSRVAPRSRPEARVDHAALMESFNALDSESEEGADSESEDTPKTKAGRVDFLAWYGRRIIAVELKAAAMNSDAPTLTHSVKTRWSTACKQAKSAQIDLRHRQSEDRSRYPAPISLALMVIVGRRKVSSHKTSGLDLKIDADRKQFVAVLNQLSPAPQFLATYTFPQEFRKLVPRKGGQINTSDLKTMYTPFVAFIARTVVNARK